MSEIEKLYENVGIGKKVMCEWTCKDSPDCNANCKHYESTQLYYPPFTAEKQLGLIKWCLDNYRGEIFDTIETEWFEEQLSAYINDIWQDLTESEQEQIKEILE